MSLDRELLSRHASFAEDEIEQRAFHIRAGDGRCFALLYAPREPKDTGFVVCHSYGLELLTLRRTERAVARELALLGYPVIAVHYRGFGDSSGSLAEATMDTIHEDVRAAAQQLTELTGTRRLGLIGARFGGLVAGRVAMAGGVDRLMLIKPALDGESYFRQMIREMHLVKLTNNESSAIDDHLGLMREQGMLDILGNDLYMRLYDGAVATDLSREIGDFRGNVLAFQVSKRAAVQRHMSAFIGTIEASGGTCDLEFVKEPPGAAFGGPAFVSTTDPNTRVDVQTPIVDHITRRTKEWMTS